MMSAMRHHHDSQGTLAPHPAPTIDDRIYTCPMHPEVRQKGPGFCPKCGMALEPEAPTTDEGPNAELVNMTRRFWVSVVFTLPLLALAMAEMFDPALVGAEPADEGRKRPKTQVVRLQLRAADQPAVHLAEPPDILPCHRRACRADAAPAPGGPEQWDLRADVLDLLAEHPFNIRLQELHDRRGKGNISGLTALDPDAAQTPRPIEVLDTQRRHRLAPHPRVAQDQKDRHVTRAAARLRGLDQRVHDRGARDLL